MPSFGHRSTRKLQECHTDLQLILNTAIKFIDFSILEGHRNEDLQNEYYHAGKSKLKWPNSKHNSTPSMAVDIIPYPFIKADWKNFPRFYYLAGFILMTAKILKEEGKISHSLRWGGDWDNDQDLNDEKFLDLPHFELFYE